MNDQRVFPSAPGKEVAIKICGIKTAGQAGAIVEAGAQAIGVNFWPRSKRYIAPDAAAEWLRDLSGKVVRVAVFVNPTEDELARVIDSGSIDWLQLHGDESPEFLNQLHRHGWPVFKAMGVKDRSTLSEAESFLGTTLLLDACAPSQYGGSGETMDWSLGAEAVKAMPDRDVILAGGLRPENVAEAVAQVRPRAVDVASGVEESPGVKDLGMVRDFIAAARAGMPQGR